MVRYLLVILLSLTSCGLFAQTWEAGVSAGGTAYMGDLNQHNPAQISGPQVGVFAQRNFNPYLSLKFNYNYGTISGADSTSNNQQSRDRNLSFHTTLNELSLVAEMNFMNYRPGMDEYKYRFTPFIFLGIGAVNYNPQATYLGKEYDLRELRTEGQETPYPNTAIVIPYGAGIKYNFSSSWNIMVSAGYRYVRSDYIDDVSGAYPNRVGMSTIAAALSDRSGERTGTYIGVPGTQRGDFRGHDTYLFVGFTLSFTILTANCYY
jgi:opacity protein-like surface antigen